MCTQFVLCADTVTAVDSSSSPKVMVNFSDLYGTLCRTLRDEQTTLLLYALLHRIDAVKAFVLSRTNIDQLVNKCLYLYSFFFALIYIFHSLF